MSIEKQFKRRIFVVSVLCVSIAVTVGLFLFLSNRNPFSGKMIFQYNTPYQNSDPFGYTKPFVTYRFNHNDFEEYANPYYSAWEDVGEQPEMKYMSFNPNDTNQLVGVLQMKDQGDQICLLEKSNKSQLDPVRELYTNDDTNPLVTPKVLPDSTLISFKRGGSYYLYDSKSNKETRLDIEGGYYLSWLNSTTALYSKVDFKDLRNVSIWKYDVTTQENTLFLENTYGCSLSGNRKFLAYGKPETPSIIYVQNLETDAIKQVATYDSTISNTDKYSTKLEWFVDRTVIQIVNKKIPAYEMSNHAVYSPWSAMEDEYDLCVFKPSSDGNQLLYNSKEHPNVELYDCNTGEKQIVYKDYKVTHMDWVE